MTKDEARQVALGYAWAFEDFTGHKVAVSQKPAQDFGGSGWYDFAHTFAQAQQDYNDGKRGSMMPVKDAFLAWQRSVGFTIEAQV